MLTKLTLHKVYAKRLGKTRMTLGLKPGVNLLIGANGSGKSTVIECIKKEVLPKEKKDRWGFAEKDQRRHATWQVEGESLTAAVFDFEQDNPRVGTTTSFDDPAAIARIALWWEFEAKSHGECTRAVLKDLQRKLKQGPCFIALDEPDHALDLDGLRMLQGLLLSVKPPSQILCAIHHPFLLANPKFHIIELSPGYRDTVLNALQKAAKASRR